MEATVTEALINRTTNAEATVVPQLNQGRVKGTGCYRSFLDFSLVTFFLSRNCEALIETIKNININEIKESDNYEDEAVGGKHSEE